MHKLARVYQTLVGVYHRYTPLDQTDCCTCYNQELTFIKNNLPILHCAYQSSSGCEQLRLPVILSLLVAATHSTEQAHRRCMCSIVTIVDSLCTHCMCV